MVILGREFLLVDGYNIIHAWNNLKSIAEYSLESARLKLMDTLSNYQGFKNITVIVVFDGYLVKGNTGSINKYDDIFVVFTKEAETADRYIERTVNNLPREYMVRVATSDAVEQIIIMGKGAIRVSAREFEHEVKGIEKKIRTKYIENRPPKNNMLADNLDSETLEWFEKMRRQKK